MLSEEKAKNSFVHQLLNAMLNRRVDNSQDERLGEIDAKLDKVLKLLDSSNVDVEEFRKGDHEDQSKTSEDVELGG